MQAIANSSAVAGAFLCFLLAMPLAAQSPAPVGANMVSTVPVAVDGQAVALAFFDNYTALVVDLSAPDETAVSLATFPGAPAQGITGGEHPVEITYTYTAKDTGEVKVTVRCTSKSDADKCAATLKKHVSAVKKVFPPK